MTPKEVRDMAASVRRRLRNLAAEKGEEAGFVLTRYAVQRLLHRLGRSEYRDRFLLKGATLFAVWSDQPHRPTRDLDLLGFGDTAIPSMEEIFRSLCGQRDPEDGLDFPPELVRGERIRGDEEYQGVRVSLTAMLGKSRIPLQVDVGFGDDVFPAPQETEVPGLLGLEAANVRAYPREAVVAEKLQVIVALGIANSRMKDFHDIWVLSREFPFSADPLVESVRRTFARRRTPVPALAPLALTAEFAADGNKRVQWKAFVRKGKLDTTSELREVIGALAEFLVPVLAAAAGRDALNATWVPGGPWLGTPT
jgi:predicted nucleotidyltransferase component of viral defense system